MFFDFINRVYDNKDGCDFFGIVLFVFLIYIMEGLV